MFCIGKVVVGLAGVWPRGRVVLLSLTSSPPDPSACRQRSRDPSRPCNDNVEIGLLQLSASWSTTRDDCTIATRAERRCSPDFRAGYSRACHGEPPSVALAAGPLAGPVQAVLSHALSLLWEVPGLYRQRRESRRLRSSTSRSSIFVVVGLLSAMVTHQVRQACIQYAGPSACNSLPNDLCAVNDPGIFRKRLETHFF